MKRALKWAGWLVVAPFLLCLLLALLLYIPPVQDFAVRQASAYVSRQTGYDISFSRLRIAFPLDIDLQNLVVLDADRDTLVAAERALVDLDLSRLFHAQLGVDGIELTRVKADTKDLIASTRVRGSLNSFALRADSLDFKQKRVLLNEAKLDGADLDIALREDTVPDDSSSAVPPWRIDVLQAAVQDSRIRFAMPGDSMLVQAGINRLTASQGQIDLGTQQFHVYRASLRADSVFYSLPFDSVAKPIDHNHLALDSVVLDAHDIAIALQPLSIRIQLDDARGSERNSQLTLDGATGEADITSERLSVKNLVMHTPTSSLKGDFDMDYSAMKPNGDGVMNMAIQTDLSKADLLKVVSPMLPKALADAWPDVPMRVQFEAGGPMNALTLSHAELTMPGSLYADLTGHISNLQGEDDTTIDADFNLETRNIDWLKSAVGSAIDGVRLPPMSAVGHVRMQGSDYDIQGQVREGSGRMDVKAKVENGKMLTYNIDAALRNVNVRHFLPKDSIGLVSAKVKARGQGTDFLASSTKLTASGQIDRIQYGRRDLTSIDFTGQMANGYGTVNATSANPLLAASISAGAKLDRKLSNITFSADITRADLHALGLVDEPLSVAMCMHAEGTTDLASNHTLKGRIDDISLYTADSLFHPTDIDFGVMLRPDSTHVNLRSGDLVLRADGSTDIERLLQQFDLCLKEIERQLAERSINQDAIRSFIPQFALHLRAGQDNTLSHIIKSNGYTFNDLVLDLDCDPHTGINGGGHIYGLNTGAMLLDSVMMHAYQDSTGLKLDARVHNGKRNPQIAFDARLNAYVLPTGAGATLTYFDDRGNKGVDMGVEATIEEEGYRLHMEPLNPILAYRTFKLNANNYVLIGRNKKVEAKVDMLADDGTALQFYSTPNDNALQDLTLEMQRVNLGELMSVIPYMPRLTGMMQGDIHLLQTADNISVAVDATVDGMTYEGSPLGQVGLQTVYMPNNDGSQFVDGSLMQTGMPVVNFTGTYLPVKDGPGELDIDASLERFPLSMTNGFLPSFARMEGFLLGDLHVGGTTDRPLVNGNLNTLDMHVLSDPYSLNFRFPNDSIEIRNSLVSLNELNAYTTGTNPLTLDGTCDFSRLDKIRLNLTARANDFELINAKPNRSALTYGKANVDINARITGTLDDLNMFGNLRLLGSSDLTYVLADSPLTVDDQLADLVTFVDFTDSITIAEEKEHPQHLNAMLNLTIDETTQLHCMLSADHSSYVNLEGGGNLVLTYSPEKDLEMKGRYTINRGKLKYTMMVIPLKEFTVAQGSYVDWRGPLMNPTLSLSATERLKTTVTENDRPRSVNFDVGLKVSQTLNNMGLEFTLDAPEDMGIQNELASMSTEQRGQAAVTMLATGMYISDANSMSSGGFSTQNALNAFLQSKISGLAGKALQSVDLSMGVENSTTATGGTTTDYSFRFAKRFWGNRISVIVGGKVSTGEDAKNTGETLIDNVSLEYRLDKSATRYVTLFYDKNRESLLDGEIEETGAGLVLRKKTDRLGELFMFKRK